METPLFARLVEQRSVARVPVGEVIRRHPKEIVASAFIRMSEQAPFYICTTFALTYLKNHLGQTEGIGLAAVSVGGAVELFVTPAAGLLGDRLGRRRVYATGSALMLIVAFPFFLLLNTKSVGLIILGMVLVAIAHAVQYGPQASYIAESFPTRWHTAAAASATSPPP